jgi:superfamily II DNA or RNA helicase
MKVLFDFDTVSRKPRIVSEHFDQIRNLLSVEDKSLVFLKRRTGRQMPVRKFAISAKGNFEEPFLASIIQEIKATFPNASFDTTEKFDEQVGCPPIASELKLLNLEPRDYQLESTTKVLKKGRGIIVLPTSAGKTLVMAMIAASALAEGKTVFVLVPDIQLVQQSYSDFISYGIDEQDVSRWTGSHGFKGTKIVVANSQILLSKTQDSSVVRKYDVLIVDETHKISSAQNTQKLIKSLPTRHKIGLTGSLPEAKFDVWTLNRIFGPIIYWVKSIDLRNHNYISKVRVVSLELHYKKVPQFEMPSMSNPTAGYVDEQNWLQTNQERNETIAKVLNKIDTNTLVLVDRIVHGEHLLEFLSSNTNKKCHFIQGSVEVEEREKIKDLMEKEHGIVCIAISKIFSTGISIKNLHNVLFASVGKARIKIIQSIGRSLRLHESKDVATIFDICDANLRYGRSHSEERKRIYTMENIPIIEKEIYV